MTKQLIVRMKYNSLVRIMSVFPSMKDEKMSSYFNRLAREMEALRAEFTIK